MQAHIARLFIELRKITMEEFLMLDAKYDLLGFLSRHYELLHLMGDDGIIEELDLYINKLER